MYFLFCCYVKVFKERNEKNKKQLKNRFANWYLKLNLAGSNGILATIW